jgi:hypothetical protein
MKETIVFQYGDLGNNCVIRVPSRKYPGVLIQGDTLSTIVSTLETINLCASQQSNEELKSEVRELLNQFKEIQYFYYKVAGDDAYQT